MRKQKPQWLDVGGGEGKYDDGNDDNDDGRERENYNDEDDDDDEQKLQLMARFGQRQKSNVCVVKIAELWCTTARNQSIWMRHWRHDKPIGETKASLEKP